MKILSICPNAGRAGVLAMVSIFENKKNVSLQLNSGAKKAGKNPEKYHAAFFNLFSYFLKKEG